MHLKKSHQLFTLETQDQEDEWVVRRGVGTEMTVVVNDWRIVWYVCVNICETLSTDQVSRGNVIICNYNSNKAPADTANPLLLVKHLVWYVRTVNNSVFEWLDWLHLSYLMMYSQNALLILWFLFFQSSFT